MWATVLTCLLIACAIGGVVALTRRTDDKQELLESDATQDAIEEERSRRIGARSAEILQRASALYAVPPRSRPDCLLLLHFVVADVLRAGAFKHRSAAVYAEMDSRSIERLEALCSAVNTRLLAILPGAALALQAGGATARTHATATQAFVAGLDRNEASQILDVCVADYQTVSDLYDACSELQPSTPEGVPALPSSLIIEDLCRQATWNETAQTILVELAISNTEWQSVAWFLMSLFQRNDERVLLPPMGQELLLWFSHAEREFARHYEDSKSLSVSTRHGAVVAILAALPGFHVHVWEHADRYALLAGMAARQHEGIGQELRDAPAVQLVLQRLAWHRDRTSNPSSSDEL